MPREVDANLGDDRMNQQIWKKSMHQSASKIGQYIHDKLPKEMSVFDMDCGVFKISRGCLRLIEEKLPSEVVSRSQDNLFFKLASLISFGIKNRELTSDSGIFVLKWISDLDENVVLSWYTPFRTIKTCQRKLSALQDFLCGERIELETYFGN